MSETTKRCETCGWPLAESTKDGCVPGNCSMRPLPKLSPELSLSSEPLVLRCAKCPEKDTRIAELERQLADSQRERQAAEAGMAGMREEIQAIEKLISDSLELTCPTPTGNVHAACLKLHRLLRHPAATSAAKRWEAMRAAFRTIHAYCVAITASDPNLSDALRDCINRIGELAAPFVSDGGQHV